MTAPIATRSAGAARASVTVTRPSGAAARAAQTARVAILGVSGYSGQELARLALAHPGLDLVQLVSREHAGKPATQVLPGLAPRAALPPVVGLDDAVRAVGDGSVDTVVACLPHKAWKELAPRFGAAPRDPEQPLRIVDLSSDYRDGSSGYVYGLAEAFRAAIAGATRIANPGCYPTAATLALLPALERGWIGGPITVSAISGISGAGRGAALRTSFVERDGGAELYRVGVEHAHVGEMVRHMGTIAGQAIELAFAPQIVPMARGILLVANAPLAGRVSPADLRAAYLARYAGEPFVRALPDGEWPETRAVAHSNRCDVAASTLHGGSVLLATAAIDNLVKGAAGQAIQNLNLMLGWPETTGLPLDGTPW